MRHCVPALFSLLLLVAGCRHSGLPSLPASHGHLSKALDRYVAEHSKEPRTFVPVSLFDDNAELVVEPLQAPAVFAEAIQVLRGSPSPDQVKQAADDLRAACDSGHEEACTFLREQFKRPRKLSGRPPDYPRQALWKRTYATVVVTCRVGVDGVLRNCTAIEGAQHGITEAVLASLATMKYAPVTLAGHPIEVPYTFTMNFMPMDRGLTDEQRIQWARARAARFPHSPQAWENLAEVLAKHAPEDPWYADALHYLHALSPRNWWACNELAWNHVRKGEYPQAAPLAQRARVLEPDNPYVLETFAAVKAATGQCEQALVDQRRAVEKLPAEWPAPERERFTRTLEGYQRQCAGSGAAPQPSQG